MFILYVFPGGCWQCGTPNLLIKAVFPHQGALSSSFGRIRVSLCGGQWEGNFFPRFGDTQELLWLRQHKVKMLSGRRMVGLCFCSIQIPQDPSQAANGPRENRIYPGIIKKSMWD